MGASLTKDHHKTIFSLRLGKLFGNELCLIPFTTEFFPNAHCRGFRQLYECRCCPDVCFNANVNGDGLPEDVPTEVETIESFYDWCLTKCDEARRQSRPLPCAVGRVEKKTPEDANKKTCSFQVCDATDTPTHEINIVGFFAILSIGEGETVQHVLAHFLCSTTLGRDMPFRIGMLALELVKSYDVNWLDSVCPANASLILSFRPTHTQFLACACESFPTLLREDGLRIAGTFTYETVTKRIQVPLTKSDVEGIAAHRFMSTERYEAHLQFNLPDEANQLALHQLKILINVHGGPLDDPRWHTLMADMLLWRLDLETRENMARLLGTQRDAVPSTALLRRYETNRERDAQVVAEWPDQLEGEDGMADVLRMWRARENNVLGPNPVKQFLSFVEREGDWPAQPPYHTLPTPRGVGDGSSTRVLVRTSSLFTTATEDEAPMQLRAADGYTLQQHFWLPGEA